MPAVHRVGRMADRLDAEEILPRRRVNDDMTQRGVRCHINAQAAAWPLHFRARCRYCVGIVEIKLVDHAPVRQVFCRGWPGQLIRDHAGLCFPDAIHGHLHARVLARKIGMPAESCGHQLV